MGFSVGSNGQWTQTFNWKPSTTAQRVGAFASIPLVNDFVSQFGTKAESNLGSYSVTPSYITNMRWNAGNTEAAVQLGDMGGVFKPTTNLNAIYNIFGGNGVDEIHGGKKNDHIQGGGGHDILHGNDGDDEIWGGAGDDTVFGDVGRDVLYGNAGNDTLYGGYNNDLLLGDAGDDTLFGDQGDDELFGGEGNDTLTGGEGADRFYLSELSGSGTKITDFSDGEKDSIHIIDSKGTIRDYTFKQDGNNVQIKKGDTLLATVIGATTQAVALKTTVGSNQFEAYANTTDGASSGGNPTLPTNRMTATAGQAGTFTLRNGYMNELLGFSPTSGHKLSFDGINPANVGAHIRKDYVMLNDGNRVFATLRPPTDVRYYEPWRIQVNDYLSTLGLRKIDLIVAK